MSLADFDPARVDEPINATFFPPGDDHGGVLGAVQLEHYRRNGFVSGLDLFGPGEAAGVRAYVYDLVDRVVAAEDDRDSYSVNSYHLACRGLWDLIANARLHDHVQSILGPDFVCWGQTVFCKLPGDPRRVSFHQDAAFWPFTPTRTTTAWLSLDGADVDNGAMQFIAGSHLCGALAHVDRDLDGTRVRKREVAREPTALPADNILAPGQFSLHADLLLHGSLANRSTRRRTGVVMRFAAAEVRPYPGWEWWCGAAVHCRGTIGAHWPHRARPAGERPDLAAALIAASGGVPVVD